MTDTELKNALGQLQHDVQEAAKQEIADNFKNAITDINNRFDKLEADLKTAQLDQTVQKAARPAEFRDYLTRGAVDGSVVRYVNSEPIPGTSSNSGVLIPDPIVREIIEYSTAGNVMREIADNVTVSVGDTFEVADEQSEVGAGWVGETDARPVTDAQGYGSITIPLREVYACPKYSNRLIADSSFNLDQRIIIAIARALAKKENAAFFNGNTTKQPQGLLTATTVANANWVPGKVGTVDAASGTAITGDDIIELVHALPDEYQANATILMNGQVWNRVCQLKAGASGANRYLLWTPDLVNGRLVRTLLGIPVRIASAMPSSIAAGNITIAVGDFRQAYVIPEKPFMGLIRDDITDKGFTKFYTSRRIGGGIKNSEAVKFLVQPGSGSASASASASDPGSASASASA